jgi:outer membrane lipoprotein-sorting protein
VLGVLLVLALTLAGCGTKITAEEIVAKMRETMENTRDAHALVTGSINAQGIELTAKAEIWEKFPNQVRVEVLEASQSRFVGTLLVSDGQQGWVYEPQRNVVAVGPVGDLELPLPQEMLTSLQDVIQEMLDVSDVELVGEETVSTRKAYKLTVRAKEDAGEMLFPGDGTATLWVDQEQWFILKASYEAGAFGQVSMEVQSFELNPTPGLPDALFHFEVPEGVTVVEVAEQQPVPLSLEEAKALTSYPLLVPDYVPGNATLIEVFRVGDSFVLRYDHSPQTTFTVVQGPELASPPPLGESQDVTVRGKSATVITDQAAGNTFLYWTEEGVTITVAGHIGLDEALKVAESLK